MSAEQPNNPLHGITLKAMLNDLVERHGWEGLGQRIKIRCFQNDPSVMSTLKFLRKTAWAREKVEQLYLKDQKEVARARARDAKRAKRLARRAAEREEQARIAAEQAGAPAAEPAPAPAPDAAPESAAPEASAGDDVEPAREVAP